MGVEEYEVYDWGKRLLRCEGDETRPREVRLRKLVIDSIGSLDFLVHVLNWKCFKCIHTYLLIPVLGKTEGLTQVITASPGEVMKD